MHPAKRLVFAAAILLSPDPSLRGFDYELIAAVSGEEEDRLLDLLDEALRAQVIRERADGGSRRRFVCRLSPLERFG